MKMFNKAYCRNTGLLLIRLAVGVIFLTHGISKLTNMEGTVAFFDGLGVPSFMAWVVALIETLGGAAMILGIYTTFAGYLLACVMIVAIVLVKSKMSFQAAELDVMLLASSLGIAFSGPGKYSLMRFIGCGCKNCKDGKCECASNGMCHCGCTSCGICDNCDMCKNGCTGHEKK